MRMVLLLEISTPCKSAGRMAKNGCDSFDLGPKYAIYKVTKYK